MDDLRFSGVTLKKGGRAILDDVAGHLRHGEVTAILGPNGAGKSSLLQCLAGLERTMNGEVVIGSAPLSAIGPRERAQRIGFLPQRGEVHWNMSVAALVALGRSAHNGGGRLSGHDQTVLAAVIADMDLAQLADRPVWSLSGGEQARALLARVIAGEPQWLFADEPLASLDPAHQIAVLRHLAGAAHKGAGVAVVLHDVNHAVRIADHILLMKDGAIIADGRREDVLAPELLEQAFGVPFQRVEGTSLLFPAVQSN